MSFRERTAWITLVTILICFGVYYGAILSGAVRSNSWASFHLGVVCISALVLLQVGLNLFAALRNPRDAKLRDERDRLIQGRSHTIGYYVLMIGVAIVLILTHVPVHGASHISLIVNIVNAGVGAMIAAALAVAISQIVMYRRGA